jgi:membrane protein YqaA with SNARE-associated domain
VETYAIAVAVIFGVNLLPAFGPPTWAVLVFFKVRYGLDTVPLVLLGGVAAAGGRFMLASGAARFHDRMSAERRASLEAAAGAIGAGKRHGAALLGLFALSPVPSAQLFVAAGLVKLRLVPLTLAFFAGRLVSYSLYVTAAGAASKTVGDVVGKSLGSPVAIALQIAMLAALVGLARVDWRRIAGPRAPHAS